MKLFGVEYAKRRGGICGEVNWEREKVHPDIAPTNQDLTSPADSYK